MGLRRPAYEEPEQEPESEVETPPESGDDDSPTLERLEIELNDEREEVKRLRHELALREKNEDGHLRVEEQRRPVRGVTGDGVTYVISRQWWEYMQGPFEALMKFQADVGGMQFRFVDDGQCIAVEMDLDQLKSAVHARHKDPDETLGALLANFVVTITNKSSSSPMVLMKAQQRFGGMNPSTLTAAAGALGALHEIAIAPVAHDAHRIVLKITIDTGLWSLLCTDPKRFFEVFGEHADEAIAADTDLERHLMRKSG